MSAATTTVVEATPDALALATRELEPAEALVLNADVAGFITRIRTLTTRAKGIVVSARGQEAEERAAKVTRLALRAERVEAIKQLKELKASSLRRGRALDGVAAIVREMTEPAEEYLKLQETYTERADAAEQDKVRAARAETLRALDADPSVFADLGTLSTEAWAALLDNVKAAHEAKLEAAKQADRIRVEAERLAAEARSAERAAAAKVEAERLERERVQLEENVRLKAEAAEREAQASAERARVAAEREAERVAGQARADAAFAEAQAEREAAEAKARAEREAAAAETRAAREAVEAAERELAKAKADRAQLEAEAAAREAAEADSRKPTKAKYAILVAALDKIAAWGDPLETADEPHAAARAREALEAVGLAPKAGQS